jgi:hypothetical protein
MKPNGSALAVLAVALLGGLIAVAHAANTSRPTGKGAIRDESVLPGGAGRVVAAGLSGHRAADAVRAEFPAHAVVGPAAARGGRG